MPCSTEHAVSPQDIADEGSCATPWTLAAALLVYVTMAIAGPGLFCFAESVWTAVAGFIIAITVAAPIPLGIGILGKSS